MLSKRKTITFSLMAITLMFTIVMSFLFGTTYTAECSEIQNSDDVGIVTTSANTYEDFSSYTDKELPETIDKSNIMNFVPVSKFNKNGTTIYNGRNYGFVIYSNAGTNHVLLFKEMYTPHEDGDGYEITLKVVYENSFFKGAGNSLIYAGSPYHIALSDIKFDNVILDSDINNSIVYENYNSNFDTGPYYTQVRYENQFSYYDGRLAGDTALAVISAAADVYGFIADKLDSKGHKLVADGIGATCTIISDGLLLYDILQTDNYWVERSTFDTDIDFPLTRQGQLEKYGSLKKDVRIDVQADKNEYLSGDNGGGFARAIYRVMNENRKNYCINNRISFEICRYNGAQRHKVDDGSIESVYSVTGTDCDSYGEISEENDAFKYSYYQRITPMVNFNAFTFNPKEVGKYSIYVPSSYYLTVDGIAQSSNVVDIDANGCKIGMAPRLDINIGDMVYSRLLPQDFYNGKVAFTNISIQKHQQMELYETTQVEDLAYIVERSNKTHNDLYSLYVGNKVDLVDLYITDEDLNVLAKATKEYDTLIVNFPMKANNVYGIVCVNRSGETLDLFFNKETNIMTVEKYLFPNHYGLYYSFKPKYNQFYNIMGAALYDEDMNLYPSEGAFLQTNQTYYLYSLVEENVAINLSEKTAFAYNKFGEEIATENIFNEMFRFTAIITASYCFADGTYDVYKDNTLIAENVSWCDLYKDSTYLFIKRQLGGKIKVYIDGETLQYGDNNVVSSYLSVYVLNLEEMIRLDITSIGRGDIEVYDAALNKVELDHGYLLKAGRHYIILSVPGNSIITVKEYLQEVNITFYVDGNIYNDATGTKYYYGKKAMLPVPIKDRYDFNGWRISNTEILITDNNGIMSDELLVDEITLVADWTLRSAVMEINFDDGTSKWWTGDCIVSQNPGNLQIEGTMIQVLVNMKDNFIQLEEGKKQGYFLSTFDHVKISSEGNVDYYKFTPVWEIEKYYIEFILPYGGIISSSRAVYYGEEITNTLFPSEAFKFDKNQELYSLVGWRLSKTSSIIKFTLGSSIIDLTPGYGSEFNHPSKGYGKDDSTLIRLSAELEYVDYNVIINSKSYKVGQDGYSVGTLGSYGYTESKFYGHNVLLTTPLKDKLFSFDGIITVNDLTPYWREGSKAVTVNLSLVDQLIEVALSYNYSGSGNQTSYSGDQGNITLKPAYVRSYKFNYWTVENDSNVAVRIDVLNYVNLGINEYYSNAGGVTLSKAIKGNFSRSSIKPTSGVKYTISDAATYVDLSRFSLMVGMTFTIASSAEEVTFVNGTCSDTKIVVSPRSSKLTLNFDDVNMQAKSNCSVIDAYYCSELEIYSYNSVTLSAGEVNADEANAAILCQNLTLSGKKIYINGGNQVAGLGIYGNKIHFSAATAGIKCVHETKTLLVSAEYVKVQGGNGKEAVVNVKIEEQTEIGAKGIDVTFGNNGGAGAVAIYFPGAVILSFGSKLECKGGAGANGSDGLKGGKGGPGRNGSLGVTFITPGDGGKGGLGGDGGDGGKSIVYNSFSGDINNLILKDGKGGDAGKGGEGGDPGDPVTSIWGNEKTGSKGAPGEDGKAGKTGGSTLA